MTEAAAAGIPPLHFWDCTYRELYNALAGEHVRRRRNRQEIMFGAWHGAAFERAKRIPDLNTLLRKMEPVREMSNQQMRAFVLGMAKAMDAKVTHVKRGTLWPR